MTRAHAPASDTRSHAATADGAALLALARREDAAGRHEAAVEALDRAARAGQAEAMAALGDRLLMGLKAPHDVTQGVAWLRSAAERDSLTALARLATLSGMGALGPPDWGAALGHLVRAAELGGGEARAQLRLLADPGQTPTAEDGPPGLWRDLADRVDLTAWTTPPERRNLFEAPRVRLAERFATDAVCDWLHGRAQGHMRPALMYDGESKTEMVDPHRTCSDYQFDVVNTDLVVVLIRERVAALTKLPTIAMEPPRVFHYALGEEIKAHFDRCGDGVEGYGHDTGYLGDRIVTFLLYLNDDFEGGDLDFPRANFRAKGAKGDAVYFAHVDMAGRPDPLSLHAGMVITRGEKWVFSQWIHDRPFGVPERRPNQGARP